METNELTAIADVSITVVGEGRSLSPYVVKCLTIFRNAGLRTNTHALGTNVEGPLPKVLKCIEECHRQLHDDGIARIVTHLTITTRTDRPQSIEEKIAAVTSKMPS